MNLSDFIVNNTKEKQSFSGPISASRDWKLKVIVKPNSKKNEILGYDENKQALRIAIAAQAEGNKANKELTKFISKLLNKKVKIKSGLKSKNKILEFL